MADKPDFTNHTGDDYEYVGSIQTEDLNNICSRDYKTDKHCWCCSHFVGEKCDLDK